jgi:hypothetical protein
MRNAYHQEQLEALKQVRGHLAAMTDGQRVQLHQMAADYFTFRQDVERFLSDRFSDICTQTCFTSQLSACCSREAIITFFADVVLNALVSDPDALDTLETRLQTPDNGFKCIYLGQHGCLWTLKPIVCLMFLCDRAKNQVLGDASVARMAWNELKRREKTFTWPDRPVLFDAIESLFLDAGLRSPLMYLHNSPGLLRVKRLARPHHGGR